MVNKTVIVAVKVGTTVPLDIAFFGREPTNGSFWTEVVFIKHAVFIVVQVFCQVPAPITIVVRQGVRQPTRFPRWAIVNVVEHIIAVNVFVTNIAKGIPVNVGLVVVGVLWAVVEPVKNTVQVKVCFVKPEPHVVLVSVIKIVGAIHTVPI